MRVAYADLAAPHLTNPRPPHPSPPSQNKKKAANKSKMKGSVETLTQWQARSAEKFKNKPGA